MRDRREATRPFPGPQQRSTAGCYAKAADPDKDTGGRRRPYLTKPFVATALLDALARLLAARDAARDAPVNEW